MMFWNSVARWTSTVPTSGNLLKYSGGSVLAPCWTAPPMPWRRAAADISSQRFEGDGYLGDGAVRQNQTTVRRAGVDADLGHAALVADLRAEHRLKPSTNGIQLVDRAVLLADFADLRRQSRSSPRRARSGGSSAGSSAQRS